MNEINYDAVFGVDTGANEPAPAQQAPEDQAAETAETKPETTEASVGEKETAAAFKCAGATAEQIHLNDLLDGKRKLDELKRSHNE